MTTSSYERLSHAQCDGQYPVVFIPQGRKTALSGQSRPLLGPVWREWAGPRRSPRVEGPMVQDHVHRLIRIPPPDAVAEGLGEIKGQSASAVARPLGGRHRHFHGERFWARGYAGATGGFEEAPIRASSKQQEQLDAQEARMSQASSHHVTTNPGSPEACSQPSSPPLCGGVMTACVSTTSDRP
jgi:putative transposase